MPRVVIDARESGTSSGRYVDKLIQNLHRLKSDIDFVVVTKPNRLEYIKSIAPGFKVVPTKYKEFTFSEQLGFLKQIRGLRADLVHYTFPQQPVMYRGRKITTIHDLTTARFSNPGKNQVIFKFKQTIYKWLIKRVARKSKHIIVPTEFVKQDVAQYAKISPKKITTTYEAADKITEASKPIKELVGKKYIMYVGRPLPHKNLRRLMEAYSIVRNMRDNVSLVLVGKRDKLYEQHARWAQKEGVEGVIFAGFASEGRLRWLYEHAAAYVFPSLSEGFGLPGLEAMAHRAPVIASQATSLPEIYGDAAEYFNPDSVSDMADAITSVISNPARARELKDLGSRQVQKYSWRKMAEQTLDVYKNALT